MQRIVLAPPLKGRWKVMNPPGHPRLAFDLHAVDSMGAPYPLWALALHVLAILPMRWCYSWSEPVYAPLGGKVIACGEGSADRTRGNLFLDLLRLSLLPPPPASPFERFGGNHVIIESDGLFVLLAHLRKGSLNVKVGDLVRVGDEIGQVGNSGASIQPHLHVQVMSSPELFPLFANLVPFEFIVKGRLNA